MAPSSARPLVFACLVLGTAARAVADDPPASPRRPPSVVATPRTKPTTATATTPAPAPPASVAVALDPAAARVEAEGRIKGLPALEKDQAPHQKALREVWTQRLSLLDDWEKAVKARREAEHPDPPPDREIAQRKAEIDQRKAMLDQLARAPDTILPELFRLPPGSVDEAKLAEMSQSIERARKNLGERTAELEKLRGEMASRAGMQKGLELERDKAHARKSTLPTQRTALESAYASATAEEPRRLARERLINFQWESALADERLAAAEATLPTELARTEAIDASIKALEAQVAVTQSWLAVISRRYGEAAEQKRAALRREAVREQARAAATDDPVEKFRARRLAEILGLEAQVVEAEKSLSANPPLSLEEQKRLADLAEKDFASLKQVVQENRIGGLVALRLNNDFRRLSRERAMIQRNELAESASLNAHYENALTEAELSLINDARDDRFERDAFVETLPRARQAEAAAAIDELEERHRVLLVRHKEVLEKLLDRAEKTHGQVDRRLRTFDAQYAFIRTHIFWVRDSEPIGAVTLIQGQRDAARVVSAVAKLGAEAVDRSSWSHVSVEFGLLVAGLVVLPPAIVLARRRLKVSMAAAGAGAPIVHMI